VSGCAPGVYQGHFGYFPPKPENCEVYAKLNSQVYRHITGYTDEILKKSFGVLREDQKSDASLKSWSPT
jgi:hypothetical protein